MKNRIKFKIKHTDKKIRLSGRIYMALVLVMFIIVIHDSFKHELPFYYILYGIAGLIIGQFVSLTQKVILTEESDTLTLKVRPIGFVLTILLLLVRFFVGRIIFEHYNVVWATDAVYLLFIGIYFSKMKDIIRQIDEKVYDYLFKSKNDNRNDEE